LQPLPQVADGLFGRNDFVADGAAVLVQPPTHFGGLHPAGRAVHELQPHGFFKLAQVVADIGARHLQLAGGLAQVARIDDVHQQRQGRKVKAHGCMSNNT
jgi:hypothetical protein